MATTYSVTAWKNPRNASYSKYGEYCAGWSNVSNVLSINGSGATLPSGEGINSSRKTAYLVAYNYGFAVPSNATIVGVEIRIQKKKVTNGGTAKDYLVILRNGATDAPRNIGRNIARGDLWSKSYTMYYYGSSRDKLGANLTPAIVNSSTFGVNFRAIGTVSTYSNIGVDGIQMRVHYAITTDTVTPPTIIEPENPDDEPTVIIPDNTDVKITDWKYPTIVAQNQETHNPTLKNTQKTYNWTTDFTNEPNGSATQTWGVSGSNVVTSTSASWGECKWYVKSNMGFNIPSNAVIKGISMTAYLGVSAENPAPMAWEWRLVKPDGTYGVQGVSSHYATTANTMRWISYTRGSSSDLWGTTWTPEDINSVNFKFKTKAGSIQPSRQVGLGNPSTITVYYTTPDGQTWSQTANIIDTNDNTATTVSLAQNQISQDLKTSGYDFNTLLDTSQIIGVEVKIIEQSSVVSTAKEYVVNLQNMATWYSDANQSEFIPTTKTTKIHGNSTFLWNQGGVLTPDKLRNSNFGLQLVYQNNATSTTTLSIFTVAVRVYYLPDRKTVQPNNSCVTLNDETVFSVISQAPTTYQCSVRSMEFIHPPNQIRQQLGYIGTITVDRGHHFDTITRKNSLMKEVASGAINYSKKGEIEEDRPLTIRIPKRSIKMLEGLVDIQGIVPIDTIISMNDNDPYAHKGFGIIHGVKHKRVNDLVSECDIDVEYVTKNLKTPLTVDYLVKTTPPLDANIITDTEDSIFYLESDTIKNIEDFTDKIIVGTPTITKADDKVTIGVGNGQEVTFTSKESFSSASNFITEFTRTKSATNDLYIRPKIINASTGATLGIVNVTDNDISVTLNGNTTVLTSTVPTTATYTVKFEIDANNVANVIVNVNDGSTVTEYTATGSLGYPVSMKASFNIYYVSGSDTNTVDLIEIGITKKLFSDNIDTTIRNIIHIPEPLGVNIPADFVRQTQEGNLYCYLNPSRDILFTLNPANYFDTSVKLIDNTGTRILTTDMVINNQSEITIDNSIIKVVFDIPNNQIKIYGFLYGWIQVATLSLANMFHIKPIQVTFDMVHIQVGETKWLLRRGKPFVEIYHPYDDLGIVDNFTHYWHDNGNGIGVVKEIESPTEPLNVNTLFYANIYKDTDNLGIQIFRPRLDNLSVKTITKSEETGIGWYNKLAGENERHYERALEYLAKSNQDIYVFLG